MKKIEELRWVRVFTPDHVPHYLVEQIRDRDYSVEEFFKYHQINCMIQSENGIKLNPFHHLYVLADKENQVKGMLWFNVDPLSKDMIIQTFSMDKEYWGKGQAVKKLSEHIKQIRVKANLNKIYWITNYPKHSMRYGFKQSKSVLMEYDPKKEVKNGENYDGGRKPTGESQSSDSRTTTILEPSNERNKSNGRANGSESVSGDVSEIVC